ncbi:MAG: DUF433 domain-containing protein [Verrucomicrobiales bacterium]|nr:DUF433 domain-containing protein [Verrucomicrobiales bacterium]
MRRDGLTSGVADVLELLANGLPPGQIIEELPDLQIEDIAVCLRFASRMLSGSPARTPATPFCGPSWRRHSRGRWR